MTLPPSSMGANARTVLVTGGGRGIGRAIALAFGAEGHRVAVASRTMEALTEVADRVTALSGRGHAVRCDVTSAESVKAALGDIEATLGTVEVLVNNAGVAESAPFHQTSPALWERTLAVNLTGPYLCTQAALGGMLARRWGRIINIASTAGLTGYAYTSAYCAAKHGLVGLTRALARELAASGVTINAICPSWVDSDMTTASVARIVEKTGRTPAEARAALEAMSPQRRLLAVEEVAAAAVYLASDLARGVNGHTLTIDGGELLR